LPPMQSTGTSSPELPSLHCCIANLLQQVPVEPLGVRVEVGFLTLSGKCRPEPMNLRGFFLKKSHRTPLVRAMGTENCLKDSISHSMDRGCACARPGKSPSGAAKVTGKSPPTKSCSHIKDFRVL